MPFGMKKQLTNKLTKITNLRMVSYLITFNHFFNFTDIFLNFVINTLHKLFSIVYKYHTHNNVNIIVIFMK